MCVGRGGGRGTQHTGGISFNQEKRSPSSAGAPVLQEEGSLEEDNTEGPRGWEKLAEKTLEVILLLMEQKEVTC